MTMTLTFNVKRQRRNKSNMSYSFAVDMQTAVTMCNFSQWNTIVPVKAESPVRKKGKSFIRLVHQHEAQSTFSVIFARLILALNLEVPMTLKCTLKPVNILVWLNQWLPIRIFRACFVLNPASQILLK